MIFLTILLFALNAPAATKVGCVTALEAVDFQQRFGVTHLDHLQDGPNVENDPSLESEGLVLEKQLTALSMEAASLYPDGMEGLRKHLETKLRSPDFEIKNLSHHQSRVVYANDVDARSTANVTIKKVNDRVGHGVFAVESIEKGAFIGEYTGIFKSYRFSDLKENAYLFSTEPGYVIDAKDTGNFTRFINHSSKSTNTHPVYVFHNLRWHVLIVATRDIEPGDQLLFDYGDGYWQNYRYVNKQEPEELH